MAAGIFGADAYMPDVIFKHVPGMANAAPVPELDAASLSEETFVNDYVAHSRPCGSVAQLNEFIQAADWAMTTMWIR